MKLGERVRERFLVRQFQRGNAEAFLKLVQMFERRLLYFLRRFERDPERSLDALQEVWLTAWRTRASLRSPDGFRPWVYRIAHGKIVEAIRAETRRRRTEQHKLGDAPGVVHHASSVIEAAELVHYALSQVSPDHREVLTLRFIEQMTIREISVAVGCPEGTVKSRLHYANQEIRCVIEGQQNARK
ncbi:MAG: RNA polymerase sigma factor [Pirellulales bacterium]